jgi:hypothetical protein
MDEVGESPADGFIRARPFGALERLVAFGDTGVRIQQHDANRRVEEEPLEALLRDPDGLREVAFARQVADERPGPQVAVGIVHDDGLRDIRIERIAVLLDKLGLADCVAI